MNPLLIRTYKGTDASIGTMNLGKLKWATIERPWIPRANAPCGTKGVSCVPAGVYQLWRHSTEAHPHTFALVNPSLWVYHYDEDVPVGQVGLARTLVLIHVANYAAELRGCIGLGMRADREMSGRWRVGPSTAAIGEFQRALTPWENFVHNLEIVNGN